MTSMCAAISLSPLSPSLPLQGQYSSVATMHASLPAPGWMDLSILGFTLLGGCSHGCNRRACAARRNRQQRGRPWSYTTAHCSGIGKHQLCQPTSASRCRSKRRGPCVLPAHASREAALRAVSALPILHFRGFTHTSPSKCSSRSAYKKDLRLSTCVAGGSMAAPISRRTCGTRRARAVTGPRRALSCTHTSFVHMHSFGTSMLACSSVRPVAHGQSAIAPRSRRNSSATSERTALLVGAKTHTTYTNDLEYSIGRHHIMSGRQIAAIVGSLSSLMHSRPARTS